MPKGNEASTTSATKTGHPDEGAIAERAYELFLQRGSISGYEVDDWLQAEAELLASLKNGVADRPSAQPPVVEAPPSGSSNGTARRPARDRGAPRRNFRQPQSQ